MKTRKPSVRIITLNRLSKLTGMLCFIAALESQAAPVKLVEQSPVAISQIDKNTVLIDFGRVAFGNLELTIPDGTQEAIRVHFGESLKYGRIDRKPPGTVRYNLTTIDPKGQTTVIAEPPADGRNDQLTNSNGRWNSTLLLETT